MTTFRVLVADDEPLARQMVGAMVRRDRDVADVVICEDGRSALAALQRETIDIALLDIEMPGTDGLTLAKAIGPAGPVIVFVTAFTHYAADAFEVLAIDYLLKPFSDERFATALDRAKTRVRERRLAALAGPLAHVAEEPAPPAGGRREYPARLTFRQGDRTIVVGVADIVWIEAEDYYVLLHTSRGRHMVRETLTSFEDRLDPRRFLRVHRAALVNLDAVRDVEEAGGLLLRLADDTRVPVSRSRRRRVEQAVLPKLPRT